jgi:calcineurin-like phosphoesterase family protein
MKFWFTSDLHLGHFNIIKLSGRPYKDILEHDEALIRNWNSRVRPDDYVFHIGDFCYKQNSSLSFKDYMKALHGHIVFIKGNHDGNNGVRTPILDLTIYHGGSPFLLTHNPSDVGYFGGNLALCGHVHELYKFKNIQFFEFKFDVCNVGVDVWQGRPIDINEILRDYREWKKDETKSLIKEWKF